MHRVGLPKYLVPMLFFFFFFYIHLTPRSPNGMAGSANANWYMIEARQAKIDKNKIHVDRGGQF